MHSLHEMMYGSTRFLCGVELLSTRGHMGAEQARSARGLAAELVDLETVDWLSITDNAGGNPMLSPEALGRPVLYAGKEVVIHLSCKDLNRNGLESTAWHLASEGFHNLLVLTGDYPSHGYGGTGKPVFDMDSVGLLAMLNEMRTLYDVAFFPGAVATNFKLLESEVAPQYQKLERKIAAGARFIICQIGFDSRKCQEMKAYLDLKGHTDIPVIGNVFLLRRGAVNLFRSGKIPGVTVSDQLFEECNRQARSLDKGEAFFQEFAAKQVAVFRGLGYRGVYVGGLKSADSLRRILEIEASFGREDWQEFAGKIRYSRPGEFFYFEAARTPGLEGEYQLSREYLNPARVSWTEKLKYRFSKSIHSLFFTPGTSVFRLCRRIYARSTDPLQGPTLLRAVEKLSKSLLFQCKDCGDCSLPEITFLCPESHCVKNQRNGPCGGTRDGLCEVADFECIWSRAYNRLKAEGKHETMLTRAPVIQDQSLRYTSSWANTYLKRDHRTHPPTLTQLKEQPVRKDTGTGD